ncbi:MAG: hypothetical protein NT167_18020 [Verrucomicrobia bacterium]|nr:hypothetical protein [Verrucomicrobiota bacterium]
MNPLFASGLFDSPWMVAIIIIVGAISNWVTKRRQEKQAEQPPEGDEPAPTASKPTGGLNLEETLRRLMGEEPAPAPPRIPRAAQVELPPVPAWHKEEPFQAARHPVPPLRPPPVVVAQASSTTIAASEQQVQAARRFEQLNEQGRHPATVLGRGRENRSPAGKRAASRWCDPRSARQAFVGSIVFAPPKSLEP